VSLTERELGGLPWIRIEGPAADAFAALGEHARAGIGQVLSDWDGLATLREHAAGPGREWLAAAAAASQAHCPGPWSELPAEAGTVGQALDYLRQHPTAGGFSYTIGDRSGRVVIAESAAGQFAWREVGADSADSSDGAGGPDGAGGAGGALSWHTNHGRFVTGAEGGTPGTSRTRGDVLEKLAEPADEPGATWFTAILAGAGEPIRVRAEPSAESTTATLCTFVADLSGPDFIIMVRGRQPISVPLPDLAS